MARPAFAARRARSRVGQLGAFGAVVFVVAAALAVIGGAAGPALDAGTRTIVAQSGPTASALRVTSPLATDPAAQDDTVTEAIADALRSVPMSVERSVVAEAEGFQLLADPALPEHAELTAGDWPSDATQTAVQDAAAAALGLAPGSVVAIGGTTLTVSGTWTALDPAAARWFGDPAVASGAEDELAGPFLVDESMVERFDVSTTRWTLEPDPEALTSAGLPALADAIARLDAGLRRVSTGESSLALSGGLAATVARATRVGAVSSGVLGLPLVLVALAGAVVLGLVARAIAGGRGGELVLLRARGASLRALSSAAARESAVVSFLGAAAAAVLAWFLLAPDGLTSFVVPLAIALGVAVVATLIATAMTVLELRAPVTGRAEAGRSALIAAAGPLLLVLVAAGLALAQYLALGAPVVVRVDGVVRIDPLALSAPVLVLLAGALVAPVVAGPVVAVAERLATAGRGILPVLPLRQLARRARAVSAAVLVVALAAGAVVLAVAFQAGASEARVQAERTATGADLRVALPARAGVDPSRPAVSSALLDGVPGVEGAFAVLASTATAGPDPIPLVAADAARLGSAAAGLEGSSAGADIPDGTAGLTVGIDVSAGDDLDEAGLEADVIAWLADPDGAAQAVSLGTMPLVDGPLELSADIPPATALLAIEFAAPQLPLTFLEATLTSVTTTGGDALAFPLGADTQLTSSDDIRVTAIEDDESPLPVVVSDALAERLALAPGSELSLRVAGISAQLPVRVQAVEPRLPGLDDGPGVLFDLGTLEARAVALGGAVPAADQLWIETGDPDAAATAIRAVLTQRATITTPRTLSPAPLLDTTELFLLAGVAVTALLAIIGFAAVAAAVGQRRRVELAPLRSLGLSVARIRAARAIELVATALIALLLGALGGLLTAALVVPGLIGVLT